jgi:hypothetical protein
MQVKKSISLSKLDVIIFAVILFVIFIVSLYLLFPVIDSPKTPDWLLGPIGLLFIFGFDIAWILVMELLLRKSPKIRIFLILLGITLSTSFLVWWIIEKTSLFDHMFG